jgi:hypothetical protein
MSPVLPVVPFGWNDLRTDPSGDSVRNLYESGPVGDRIDGIGGRPTT